MLSDGRNDLFVLYDREKSPIMKSPADIRFSKSPVKFSGWCSVISFAKSRRVKSRILWKYGIWIRTSEVRRYEGNTHL